MKDLSEGNEAIQSFFEPTAESIIDRVDSSITISGNDYNQTKCENSIVSSVALIISQRCNLSCIYCFAGSGTYGAPGMMNENTARQAIDWIITQSGNNTNIRISFFGGEPLMNLPVLKTTVAYAEKQFENTGKTVSFSLVTNGTLLSDDIIVYAAHHNIRIKISLDGIQDVHDRQRPYRNGSGSYRRILEHIPKLLTLQPDTVVSATIIGDTDPRGVRCHLNSLGFRNVEVQLAMPMSIADRADTPMSRPVDGVIALIREYADDILSRIRNGDVDGLQTIWKFSTLGLFIKAFIRHRKHLAYCDAGRGFIAINSEGNIYPCPNFCGYDDFLMGNIHDERPITRCFPDNQLELQAKCQTCFARFACGGSCCYENLAMTGSMHEPPEDRCRVHRKRTELAAYIASELTKEQIDFLEKNHFIPPKPWFEDIF